MKRLWYLLTGLLLLIGVIACVIWLWPKPLIPKDIQNKVTSVIFVPKNPQVINKKGTVKYDSDLKLLSYQATIFGVNTVISEQPTPESFTDIPQVYQKVLDSWNQYETFNTPQGTVYLTRPGKQSNEEVGVMNSKGTFLFIKPDSNFTDSQWRQLFNSLQTDS
ncbi:MAG TPA: hypothetical protein VEH48_00050 [Candidatus Nitrosopolaris sp.]|nr:hypothetical protein [Candidatus Nitrosopolaris sp.]